VQSAVDWQTTMPAGQVAAQRVPVKPVHSVHELPHDVTVVAVPVPQQMRPVPASNTRQSFCSWHCQSMV
jgi:hypothetical protein